MDKNRYQDQSNQVSSNARGQQQSKKGWDGNDRRMGTPDRRQGSDAQRSNRNTTDDLRMMNEGSSR
jgi:hypothetical protein